MLYSALASPTCSQKITMQNRKVRKMCVFSGMHLICNILHDVQLDNKNENGFVGQLWWCIRSRCYLITLLLRNIQMSLTAYNSLVIPSQHFQCVTKVSAGFAFSNSVSNCSKKAKKQYLGNSFSFKERKAIKA